jgi:hypothetical protein
VNIVVTGGKTFRLPYRAVTSELPAVVRARDALALDIALAQARPAVAAHVAHRARHAAGAHVEL